MYIYYSFSKTLVHAYTYAFARHSPSLDFFILFGPAAFLFLLLLSFYAHIVFFTLFSFLPFFSFSVTCLLFIAHRRAQRVQKSYTYVPHAYGRDVFTRAFTIHNIERGREEGRESREASERPSNIGFFFSRFSVGRWPPRLLPLPLQIYQSATGRLDPTELFVRRTEEEEGEEGINGRRA